VLAALIYRARLVPSSSPVLGLIGGPVVFVANLAVMFGIPRGYLAAAAVPVFAWEICLALYLILRVNMRAETQSLPVGHHSQLATA
jgi:uncharacterized protein DUF4386